MPSAQYNLSPDGKTFIGRDNSFAGLEIGDIKQPGQFFPQFKLRRWGKNQDEANISFRLGEALLIQESAPQVSQVANKISWIGKQTQADFYDIGGLEENTGSYEMDVTLLVKPASPIIPVTLNVPKNLDLFYQPPLTADEIKEGHVRPDKAVGSYALYHKSMAGDYTAFDLDNYKAGKFGHIYRPWLIDANGRGVWGDLNIDLVKQLLTVTIPTDFYNSCAWPVRQAAGLEFGYHTVGASSYSYYLIYGGANPNPASNGVLTAITAYTRKDGVSSPLCPAIYSDNSNYPNQKLAAVDSGGSGAITYTLAWVTSSINYNNIIAGTYYWLCWKSEDSGNRSYYYYDTGSYGLRITTWLAAWPNPAPSGMPGGNTNIVSIYATYTPAAAGGGLPFHLFSQPQGVF
jgi:hypothetical protein